MAPLLAPIFKANREEPAEKSKPRDPALERLEKVNVNLLMTNQKKGDHGWGDFETGRPIDLVVWQKYFQHSPQQSSSGDQREAARSVFAMLGRWSSELEELGAAADRPCARFPLDYSKGMAMQLPHTRFLLRFSTVYSLRANAALEAGDIDLAFRDLRTLDRLQAAIRSEPLLISAIVRVVIVKMLAQVVWQGTVDHRWEEGQLNKIEAMLTPMDLVADFAQTLRGERAATNSMYEGFRAKRRPVEWIVSEYFSWRDPPLQRGTWLPMLFPTEAALCRNQLWNERWLQDHVFPVIDARAHRVHPERQREADQISSQVRSNPYNFIARISVETYSGLTKRIAATQVAIDQARVACALERFRLKAGEYPQDLSSLIPDYVPALPHDIIDGEALRYRLKPDKSYLLYSLGWNEMDDGGAVELKTPNNYSPRDNERGDWVWFGSARK